MTMTTTAPPQLPTTPAELVLLRMALSPAKSPSPKAIRDDVAKLRGRTLSTEELQEIRQALVLQGHLAVAPRKSFMVTPQGLAHVCANLGIEQLPARLSWNQLVTQYLLPLALQLPPTEAARLKSAQHLAAQALHTRLSLPGQPSAKLTELAERVVFRELGFPQVRSFNDLKALILSRYLELPKPLPVRGLEKQFALAVLDVAKLDATILRLRIVRDALSGASEPQPATTATPAPHAPVDLATFAELVLTLARNAPPADRYYQSKVFISALWRASQREPRLTPMTLEQFKARLVEANTKSHLQLVHADVVVGMNVELVVESETKFLTATFHFVRLVDNPP
jgi:hypothetical protein